MRKFTKKRKNGNLEITYILEKNEIENLSLDLGMKKEQLTNIIALTITLELIKELRKCSLI